MKWPEKIVVSAGKNIMGETLLSVEMESEFAGPDERVYILAPQPGRRKPSKTRAGSDVTQGWDDRHSLLDDDEPIARKRRKPARRGGAK